MYRNRRTPILQPKVHYDGTMSVTVLWRYYVRDSSMTMLTCQFVFDVQGSACWAASLPLPSAHRVCLPQSPWAQRLRVRYPYTVPIATTVIVTTVIVTTHLPLGRLSAAESRKVERSISSWSRVSLTWETTSVRLLAILSTSASLLSIARSLSVNFFSRSLSSSHAVISKPGRRNNYWKPNQSY